MLTPTINLSTTQELIKDDLTTTDKYPVHMYINPLNKLLTKFIFFRPTLFTIHPISFCIAYRGPQT